MAQEIAVPSKRRFFYGWVVLFVSFATHFLATGARATFSIFILPLTGEFGWSRASISLTMSIHTFLQGLAQPFAGRLVDVFGPKRMIAIGIGVMGAALVGLAFMQDIWLLYILYGVVAAMAYASGGQVAQASLISRWFSRRRGLAISIGSTGTSLGQLIIIPLAMALILGVGWRMSYGALGLSLLLITVPLTLTLLRNTPAEMGLAPDGDPPRLAEQISPTSPSLTAAVKPLTLREIVATRTFLLLTSGFFICGFTVNLVITHLAPFGHEHGLEQMAAASALGLSGVSSLVGVLATGALSDRYGRKNPLAAMYFVRGIGLLVIVFGSGDAAFFIGTLLYGLSNGVPGSMVPALLADNFGIHSMGTLFGLVLVGHQVMGAISSYLGGALFDATGSYTAIFLATALATFVGAILIFLIREKKLA